MNKYLLNFNRLSQSLCFFAQKNNAQRNKVLKKLAQAK